VSYNRVVGLMQPEKLGRYQIVRELGRGAMGVVYEATDPNIGRTVALKTIRVDAVTINAEELSRRFKNEARAAGRLNHPNIVTVYDAGEEDGVLYIAMELLEGHTLQALLAERHRLRESEAIDLVRQVCAGLHFAHEKGIVHRDIKPGNVILASNGFVKITDFGVARTGEAVTLTGQILGTPHYMSPEQVLGKTLDARSDLFSVGVILYEMLTGERPFEAQSVTTVMYKIVHETPIPPRAIDTSIHPGLSAVIEKALAKSPDLRYQTAAELAAALANYCTLDPAQVPTITTAGLSAQETVTVATPAPVLGAPIKTKPQATGLAAGTPVFPKSQKTLTRRIPMYALAVAAAVGLVVLGWALYGRSRQTVPNKQAPSTAKTEPVTPAGPNAQSAGEAEKTANSISVFQKASLNNNTAEMTVNSSPPGARILIDGVETGKRTPATVQMARGEHTVALKLEGFEQSAARFKVRGGEQFEFAPTLSVAMPNVSGIPQVAIPNIDLSSLARLKEKMPGRLAQAEGDLWQQWGAMVQKGEPVIMVTTRPPGARILLDGKDTDKKSPAVIPLSAAGTYRVELELQGFQSEEREVNVQPHAPGNLQITLHATSDTEQR
jgi:serine/threonine protein kinase